MPKFFDSASDRRQAPRTKLVEIAYIGMGSENGGLVLDVSDGGLSFHSVAPVQPAQEIRFLLSLRGHSRIEGTGEVVWTNEMKTVCGLRFTSLSSGAREHLNNWTNQTRTAVAAYDESLNPASQPSHAPPEPSQSVPSTIAVPVFTIPAVSGSALTFSESRSIWQKPVFLWTLFAVLSFSISFAAYQFGLRVGKSQIASSSLPTAPSASPDDIRAFEPVPAAGSGSPGSVPPDKNAAAFVPSDIFPVPAPDTPPSGGLLKNSSKSEDRTPAEMQSAAAKPGHAQSPEAGKSQFKAAMAYLNGDNGRKDIPAAVHLLWAAVANGNADAEITLADLYAAGDGIDKNCDQARILLKAAANTGSSLAQEKLQDLETNGCP